ncbi:MAG: serine/threonine-protein kinase, partial [Myxococcota bacterium]
RRIGLYDIEDKIASGGMGEVLLGYHQLLGRACALKRLVPPDDAEDDLIVELEERFQREGKVLAQLSHQAICGVYDLFTWRGTTYLALEYIDGYDLRDLLKNGPLPIDVALIVGCQTADALQHAHMHGIIHRDVKPANIMISRSGEVKLMDFGIARGDELEVLTRTGMLVGTPTYMAPEVLRGEEAGVAADTYSLAATLYRCLAGEPMFPKGQQPEVIYRSILEGKIPQLRSVNPNVPRSLSSVIHKGLATDQTRRFKSAGEFRNALQDELARFGTVAMAERLVQFLYADGHLTEEAAATVVQPAVLRGAGRDKPLRRQPTGSWMAATALAASITVVGLVGIWAVNSPAGDTVSGLVQDIVGSLSAPPTRALPDGR